jgi:hypothetical protein
MNSVTPTSLPRSSIVGAEIKVKLQARQFVRRTLTESRSAYHKDSSAGSQPEPTELPCHSRWRRSQLAADRNAIPQSQNATNVDALHQRQELQSLRASESGALGLRATEAGGLVAPWLEDKGPS